MEPNKKKKALYWAAKIFISMFIAFSAYYSYSHTEDLAKLGFPAYFRKELVTAKIIGAIVLLLPITPARVKEWIYAGFIIAMVSALVAHVSSGDPVPRIIFVSVDLILILLSMRYVSNIDLLNNRI